MEGMAPGDDFLKQIEGTWRQIKSKTEELQRAQAEIARLGGLVDKASADLAASSSREREVRAKLLAVAAAVKERDAKAASIQAAADAAQAGRVAAEQAAAMLQAQLADLVERCVGCVVWGGTAGSGRAHVSAWEGLYKLVPWQHPNRMCRPAGGSPR